MPRNHITRVPHTCLLISVISMAIGFGTYHSSASNTADPVTKLTGDFVGVDTAGNNHLTLVGGAAQATAGFTGPAFSFDGLNGHAKVNSQTYSLSGGSVSLWFLARNPHAHGVITGSYDNGNRRTPTFFISGGFLRWEFANIYFEPVLTAVNPNQWYHVAMTYDSNLNVKVYLNGSLVAQRHANNPGGFPAEFVIGAYSGPGQFFDGLVDEVKVYNQPLSDTEVQAIYVGQDVIGGLLSSWPGTLSPKDCPAVGNCTLQNGVIGDVGRSEQAFSFDGVDDQVLVPDSAELSGISLAMSIKAWIKTTDISPAPRIATKLNPGSSGGFDLHLSNGKLQMSVSDAQGQVGATSVNGVNDGNWHSVAGVYDGAKLSLYVDGVLDAQSFGSLTIHANNGQPLTVGAWQGAFPYAGLIDELEIHDRALTETEAIFMMFGGATFDPGGKSGHSFSFDGLTGYARTNSQTYPLSGGTVALWFLSRDPQAESTHVITGSYDGGDRRTPTFFLDNGYLRWEFANVYYQPSLTPVNQNQWYHVAMTYDSNFNVKVYLNGLLAAQQQASDPGGFPQMDFVGAYSGPSQFFNGLVDEMVIYKRSLTADEIRQMVPSVETSAGTNVTMPIGQTELTFSEVTTAGTTTVTPIDPSTVGQVPGGFAVSNSVAYEIATTATFTGSVTLAFKVPGPISEEDFNNLAIFHNENGTLVDVTAATPALDYANLTIYATTTSFSPFYLARKGPHIKTLFDQTKAYKRGSTIPLKLQLLNASNVNTSSLGTSLATRDLRRMSGNTLASIEDSGNSTPDYTFRYDPTLGGTGGGYIFNLSTKGLAAGSYVLSFYVGSDRSFFYSVTFEVK